MQSETKLSPSIFSDGQKKIFQTEFCLGLYLSWTEFHLGLNLSRTEFCLGLHTAVVFRMQSFNILSTVIGKGFPQCIHVNCFDQVVCILPNQKCSHFPLFLLVKYECCCLDVFLFVNFIENWNNCNSNLIKRQKNGRNSTCRSLDWCYSDPGICKIDGDMKNM